MWIIRWIFVLAVIILAAGFILSNTDLMVTEFTFKFWNFQIVDTSLLMSLFVAFIFGALAWFPIAIWQYIQTKAEIRNLRKENSRLQKELVELRNISIDDEDTREEGAEK